MFGADPPRQGVPVAGWGFFRGTRAVQRHRHRGAVDPPPRLNLEPVGYLLLGESSGYAFEENLVGWQDTSGRRAREGKAASRRPARLAGLRCATWPARFPRVGVW